MTNKVRILVFNDAVTHKMSFHMEDNTSPYHSIVSFLRELNQRYPLAIYEIGYAIPSADSAYEIVNAGTSAAEEYRSAFEILWSNAKRLER